MGKEPLELSNREEMLESIHLAEDDHGEEYEFHCRKLRVMPRARRTITSWHTGLPLINISISRQSVETVKEDSGCKTLITRESKFDKIGTLVAEVGSFDFGQEGRRGYKAMCFTQTDGSWPRERKHVLMYTDSSGKEHYFVDIELKRSRFSGWELTD